MESTFREIDLAALTAKRAVWSWVLGAIFALFLIVVAFSLLNRPVLLDTVSGADQVSAYMVHQVSPSDIPVKLCDVDQVQKVHRLTGLEYRLYGGGELLGICRR